MPSIPTYQEQTLPQGQVNAQANPNDFGAQVGQATQAVGQSIGQASDFAYRLQQEAGMLQAGKDVEQVADNARKWYDDQKSKLDPLNDPNYTTKLAGLEDQFHQYLGDQRQQYLDANGNNRAYATFFNQHMVRLSMGMSRSVHSDIASSTGEYFKSQLSDSFKVDTDAIRRDPSDDNVGRIVQKQLETIGNINLPGFNDVEKMKLRDQYMNQAAFAQYSARAARDPYGMYSALGFQGASVGKGGPRGGGYTQQPDNSVPAPTGGFGTPNINAAVARYAGVAKMAGTTHNVDPNFLLAQVQAESSGNPAAVNAKTSTGQPSVGVSQFQPGTAAQYGVNPNDATSSINGQAHYMGDLLKQFGGDYAKAAAAYNWGPSRVASTVSKFGADWQQHIPTETQNYLSNIFSRLPGAPNGASPQTGAQQPAAPRELTDAELLQADSKQMGGLWTHLTDGQRVAIGRQAEQGIRADQLAIQQNALLKDKAVKDQQARVENGYLNKLIDGTLTVDDIRSDQTLTAAQREHFYNAINSQTQKQDKTDPTVFNDVFSRIHLPDTDPNKITDPDQLNKYMGQGLSFADIGKLRGEIKGRGTPDAELMTQFKSMAKAQISGSSLIAKDPDGDKQFYNWSAYVDNVVAEKQKKGVSLHEMLDPSSREYLGSTIQRFVRTPQQQMQDSARRMSGGSSASLPPEQQRKPGESAADYLKRTGAK